MDIWHRAIMASSVPAAGGFDVLSLAPTLWLSAADPATLWLDTGGTSPVSADSDPIARWDDKSGNGYHVTQASSGGRPLYRTAVLNSKPVVRFDGSDDVLSRVPVPGTISGATAFEAWLVMRDTGAVAQQRGFLYGSGASTIGAWATYEDELYFDHAGVGGAERINVAQPGGWNSGHHLVTLRRDGGYREIAVDGSILASNTTAPATFDTGASDILNIGAASGGATSLGGDIAEIIFFDHALSSGERASLTAHLQSEWGL